MTRRLSAARAGLAVIAVAAAAVAALPVAFPAASRAWIPAALAGDAPASSDPFGDAQKLRDEAKPLFRTAGDTSLDQAERGKARKECFAKLKSARELLDRHLKEQPGDAERIDPVYVEVATMMFWLKKEMTLSEVKEVMGGGGPKPPAPAAPGAPGAPAPSDPGPGGADASGIGGTKPRSPGVPPGSGGPGAPGAPSSPQPPVAPQEPEVPKGPSLADLLAEVETYAKEHPGDTPGQVERYEAFLAEHPDSTTPEFGRAAETRKGLEDKMKEVYRLARDDDPEAIRTEDPAEAARRLKQLVDDLKSADSAVRARAAKLLGFLGSDEAVPALIDLVRGETEEPVRDAVAQALADLASRRTYDRLSRASGKDAALLKVVVEVMTRAIKKGGPAGRLAGEELAAVAVNLPEEPQLKVIETLKEGGPAASVGLARAAATFAPDAVRADLIERAGKAKDARAVPYIAKFLFVNPGGMRRDQAAAAREAIEAMGKPAVRYLIPSLDDPALSLWAGELLRKITETKQKDDKRKTWEAWFKKNRKSLE